MNTVASLAAMMVLVMVLSARSAYGKQPSVLQVFPENVVPPGQRDVEVFAIANTIQPE